MKHAYLIIAHNEWRILRLLLALLDDKRNDIYIHVDKRAQDLREKVDNTHLRHATLHRIQQPLAVKWGNYSQVETEMLLFETALAHGPYEYYHLLSGVDLPLKTQDDIHHFFHQHQGTEFLGYFNGEAHEKDKKKKVAYFYFFNHHKKEKQGISHSLTTLLRNFLLLFQKTLPPLRRPAIPNLQKGSNWVSITQALCEYIVSLKGSKRLTRFKYTLCPDELFLHTLVWDSPFRARLYDTADMQRGSMRKIDWQRGSPYVWKDEDYKELVQSQMLFARKFSSAHYGIAEAIYRFLSADSHQAPPASQMPQ